VPSQAVDDYLKAIFEIAGDNGRASTASLAKRLHVAPASVTGMLQKLAEQKPPAVQYEKHHGARLSKHGRLRALEVIRHHRLIELFLHRVLGYRWDEVHEEAEHLEHAISETLEDRIAERLGDPEVDPHGHPIPRKDGSIPERRELSLVELYVGAEATVSRVSDSDPEILRYLFGLGIVPGVRVRLTERGPFDGPLVLNVDGIQEARAIGPRVASEIHVLPPTPARPEVGASSPERAAAKARGKSNARPRKSAKRGGRSR
jgi:DtxR family Mn-dependent transcriptional regulator